MKREVGKPSKASATIVESRATRQENAKMKNKKVGKLRQNVSIL